MYTIRALKCILNVVLFFFYIYIYTFIILIIGIIIKVNGSVIFKYLVS